MSRPNRLPPPTASSVTPAGRARTPAARALTVRTRDRAETRAGGGSPPDAGRLLAARELAAGIAAPVPAGSKRPGGSQRPTGAEPDNQPEVCRRPHWAAADLATNPERQPMTTDHSNPIDHTQRKDTTMRDESGGQQPVEGPTSGAAKPAARRAAPNGEAGRAGTPDLSGRSPRPHLRAALRREARAASKPGRLTDREAADLELQRSLPADLPGRAGLRPYHTSSEMARKFADVVDRSGVVGPLERRLQSGPGPKPALTIRLLLTAVLTNALSSGTVLLTYVCRTIAGLDPQTAFDLGACTRRGWVPISYAMVRRLYKRILDALEAGFVDPVTGEVCDLKWIAGKLVAASIPPGSVASVEACAVDRLAVPTQAAVPASNRGGQPAAPAGGGGAGDAQPGTGGPIPGCSDPDARFGYRTATRKHREGQFVGYDAVMAVACGRYEWRRDVEDPGPIRAECPPFIVGVSVEPAGRPPGPAGLDVVRRAMRLSPRISEVVAADLAFAVPSGGFARPLHSMGINVVMGLPPAAVAQAKTVTISGLRRPHIVLMLDGQPYPAWMPQRLWAPPPGLTRAGRAAWFNQRAALYAYVPVRTVRGSDGQLRGIRFKCPVCAGRVAVAGQARRPVRAGAPWVPGPPPGQPCCQGTVMVGVDLLDLYQRPPYGTDAHTASYTARRALAENAIWHVLRGRDTFDSSVCQQPGIAAHTMAVVALAAAYNVRLSCRGRAASRGALPAARRSAGRPHRGADGGSR